MLFSRACGNIAINVRVARERAGGICTREAREARVFIKLAEKREKRKNESGEHACNRLSECMGNRSGEHAGGTRGSKRNDWTDNHAKARAGKWLKRE